MQLPLITQLSHPQSDRRFPASSISVGTVDVILESILRECGESCAAFQSEIVASPEWYKRAGEILAYGRLTHLLVRFREQSGAGDTH